MSYLAKVMLESKGYDVMLRNADIAPVFVSMAAGKVDVFMDAWLPATHADYIRKYGDNLEALGVAIKMPGWAGSPFVCHDPFHRRIE